MGKHKSVVCKTCFRVMRSDVLNRHMKLHDKHNKVEPLPSVTPNYVSPSSGSSFYKLTNIDKEMILKKMLKDDREYKKKLTIGEQIYEFVREYKIDEESISKELREPLEIYKEHTKRNV